MPRKSCIMPASRELAGYGEKKYSWHLTVLIPLAKLFAFNHFLENG